jgi:hypothetical protein
VGCIAAAAGWGVLGLQEEEGGGAEG